MNPPRKPPADPGDIALSPRRGSGRLDFPVVLLAASAGGIEALRVFLSTLPPVRAALVVLTHTPPDKKSHLREVLQAFTPLPVREVEGDTPLAPGVVYTVPSGQDLGIARGVLKLLESHDDLTHRIIDRFLDLLAQDQGRNAACVILSGAGSDGAAGALRLARAGGLVLVQSPATALHTGMPLSAVQTGVADAVLPLEELAPCLARLLSVEPKSGPIPGRLVREFVQILLEHSGQDLSGYRVSTITRRIHKRMLLAGTRDPEAYLMTCQQDPGECARLFRSLFIGVTAFFRDPESFIALRDKALPSLFSGRTPGDSLRVWVAGCSTGEEAYSLAMLLDEYMREHGPHCTIKIFASDIDLAAVDTARRGTYPAATWRPLSEERLATHFQCKGKECRVVPALREQVVFVHHNLLQDPPFLHMDLVICRNLLIYLSPELQERTLRTLVSAVEPGGFLMLGPTESADALSNRLETVDAKWRLFRHKGPTDRRGLSPYPLRPCSLPASWTWPESVAVQAAQSPAAVANQALLRHFQPPAVLVDPDFKVLHVSGEIAPYLALAEGEPSLSLLKLARKPLRPHLRSALSMALSTSQPVRATHIRVPGVGRVGLSVDPVPGQDGRTAWLLVLFESSPSALPEAEPAPGQPETAQLQRYETELHLANEQLQKVIERHEGLTEELRASNEELISMNEELQSSNEEMDASREELQALNEELSIKVEELARSRAFTESLLKSSNVPMLFLDLGLNVLSFTPEAREVFHLTDGDQGRPLSAIKPRLDDPRLMEDAARILDGATSLERENSAPDGRTFLKRISPLLSPTGQTEGVVLTYAEVTSLKAAEGVLRRGNEELEGLVAERARELYLSEERLRTVADFTHDWEYWRAPDGSLAWVSPSCERVSGYTAREFMDDLGLLARIVHPDDRQAYLTHIQEGDQAGSAPYALDFRIIHCSGRVVWIDHHCINIARADGTPLGRRASNRDITDRKRAEEEAASWAKFPQENPNPILRLDPGLTVTHANPASLAFLGYFGSGPGLPFPAEFRDRVRAAVANRKPVHFEVRLDGTFLTMTAMAVPDQDYVNVYGLDVTDRRRAEKALARSEERLRLLVESAPDAIFIQSEGRFAFANPEALTLFGAAQAQDLLGTPILDRIHPDFRQAVIERISTVNAGQVPGSLEERYLRLDGSIVEVEVLAVPYAYGDKPAGLVFARDISTRKRMERAQAQVQAEITRQRDFLEHLVDNAPIVIGVVEGPEHRYVQANPAYEAIVPAEARPLAGHTLAEVFPEVAGEVKGIFDSVYQTGQPARVREFPVPIGPNLTWWDADYLPLTDESGKVARILIIGHEITEVVVGRRLAEEEALKNQAVIDNLVEGLIMADVSGNVLYVNPAALKIYGLDTPDGLPSTFDDFNRIMDMTELSGQPVPRGDWPMARALRGETVAGREVRLTRLDTGRTWLARYNGAPVTDRAGRFLFSFITFEDITQSKAAEAALMASEERFRQLVESAPMVIFVQTRGRFAYVNARALEVFGAKDPGDLVGAPILERIHPAYRDIARERIRQLNEERTPALPIEYPILKLDGGEAYVELAAVPFEWGGENGALVFALEISERRMTRAALLAAKQAAETANRAKSEFLANMSHEIRTPLNGLLGMLQLLLTTRLDAEQKEYTDVALRSGSRLTRLLSDILDLSRIEAGRILITEGIFRLSDIMSSLKDTFRPLCLEKGLKLATSFEPEVPDFLTGDEVRIRQVLFNLVGNALKFTQAGEVQVRVSTLAPVSQERVRLLFMISDTGVGIPDDQLATVCDPFTQVESSYTRTQQGAGLGLAITKRLVNLMQGTLSIESEENQGTTVYCMLPMGLPRTRPQTLFPDAPAVHDPRAYRILLAEDDPVSQIGIRRFLEKSGCQVTAVSDGRQALSALRDGPYDCVLMDVQMPVLDGVSATRVIRNDPSGIIDPKIPVVAMTAYAMTGDRELFLGAGMDDYLAKPVDMDLLLQTIEQVVARRGKEKNPA